MPRRAPIFAVEVEEDGGVLKKRKFRSRAHANPLADPHFEYPVDREYAARDDMPLCWRQFRLAPPHVHPIAAHSARAPLLCPMALLPSPLTHSIPPSLPRAAQSVDWSMVYPAHCDKDGGKMKRPIDFADIGCGFGGLLMELGKNFPDKISIGIEIREKVSSYVDQVG